jgi:Domain of unknown function (DUF5668)
MEIYRSNRACGCLRCRFRGIMGAVVLVTLGVLFLLQNFHAHDLDFDHTWPLLLISIGVVKMLQRSASIEGHVQPPPVGQPFAMPPVPPAAPVPPMPGTQPSASSSSESRSSESMSSESSSEVRHE